MEASTGLVYSYISAAPSAAGDSPGNHAVWAIFTGDFGGFWAVFGRIFKPQLQVVLGAARRAR